MKPAKPRVKTFTGCWTCRSRKVKCDLRRPGCERCEKGGLICGGYDVKLRWTRPIQFDTMGNVTATPTGIKDPDEPQYQRRNVDFVRYKEEYVYYEDMDDELSALSSPPLELISEDKTWIIKKFGVFKGTDKVKKRYVPRKKRKKNQVFINAIEKAQKKLANKKNKVKTADSDSKEGTNLCTPEDMESSSANDDHTSAQQLHSLFEFDMNSLLFPGNEWISNELRDDALLSASAVQGETIPFMGIRQNNTPDTPQTPLTVDNMGKKNGSVNGNCNDGRTSGNDNEDELARVYRLLFHRRGSSDQPPPPTITSETKSGHAKETIGIVPLRNFVELNVPGSTMPRSAIEVIHSQVPDPSIFNRPGNTNPLLDIPTTGVHVHGLARFLLNYYLQNVADLMTVVVLPTNSWKTIYFPRALKALGDLTGIGYTSNSRNSLLNALLAVSCFNLQSKFPKNSPEMKFFLTLGIEFRTQASSFLKRCLSNTVNQERYKDILTAILSMNSIDVVWGTMADCQVHLAICEDFVENRMKTRPKISAKAKALHRIFSFLKLIQDSTSLDKVRTKEIVILDNNSSIDSHISSGISLSNGEFKESLNREDGKIVIEFFSSPSSGKPSPVAFPKGSHDSSGVTTPIFSNIASESYYYPKSNDTDNNILSTDALYGLPNSLILLFSDCVRLARHLEYYRQHNIVTPKAFKKLCTEFEQRILSWKSEWDFKVPGSPDHFVNDTIEGVYHHTMSFYNGLIIYYFTVVKGLTYKYVKHHVQNVLNSLIQLTELIENKGVKIVPLIWQGFMAGCACIDSNLQLEFKEWAAKLCKSGMGSYWGARQIMFEVWRRRLNGEQNDDWFSVYKDWEMNLMLS
ncbi:Arg81p [Kluyveromyces lactis]|uniref:KLLA0D10197p n=1 Tax=Kluyveromyces lactis (strain ATCC 8585 / CBS 2359 / DSM 70799 / NBRC 1267 / NRRL Y-1140 / WM37) TaxID=284590 RepID=Q6CRC4_KLULA|nr:uncharacterized protein KLLA0_D10197g [Kluyveromyces lactis]CAH00611.1 KLLA0D10197p [Kluyveromyces lactis]|eukprot:XP_453515.1 uncharacterized protein KLLA0_D10197g [Kluyveromyces lactis]